VHPFSYDRPGSRDEAVALLGQDRAFPLGGGTDLLSCVEDGVAAPARVVDLRTIPGFDAVEVGSDGSIRIGAAARLADIAAHEGIRARWPLLADACDAVGTPALRNMGTLGGNLCQRPRCWYFRRAIPCLKNGGHDCPARAGENQYHAILDGGPCYIVHPSDPAVALTALDADVEIMGPAGTSVVPITSFFVLPRDRMDLETVLRRGEVVASVRIPPGAVAAGQRYRKVMQRGAWDFALVSIAAARRADGSVRIVLGGVAPRPWRVPESVEEDVASGGLDEDSIAALAERALYDAEPLGGNGYKARIAASLLRDAMRELAAS
jgi:xanthine dehydrogenase YagS FAD-binding subunit